MPKPSLPLQRFDRVGVWERDLQGGGGRWDAQVFRLYEIEPANEPPAMDAVAAQHFHPDDVERALRDWRRSIERPGRYGTHFRLRFDDGRVKHLHSLWEVIGDDEGRPVRAAGVLIDDTESVALALRLHDAQAQVDRAVRERAVAEAASRAKSDFLARMSHELRTPLNAVLGFAQLLSGDPSDPLSAAQRERVQHILLAGEHLLALINDTLDLAGIEAGTLPLSDEIVPLQAVVGDVADWIRPAAEHGGLTLEVGPMDGSVRGDGRRVRQVLLNLLSNAVKYNRPGGRVTLTARRGVDAHWRGIEVADTGTGLAPEQLKRMFMPFDRLGAERRGIPGTGIGLSIVRHLAEQMGGRIEVASEPGIGSRFTVWLRAA